METKTLLDQILEKVIPKVCEVTMDTEGYLTHQVERVLEYVKAKGLSASYDGRFILIRDLR
jgi:hypothetical protein